jgi:non-heme chloroperoxidase
MDTYAADVDELVTALKLTNAIHVGHSTGGGEVIRYVAQLRKGSSRKGGHHQRHSTHDADLG